MSHLLKPTYWSHLLGNKENEIDQNTGGMIGSVSTEIEFSFNWICIIVLFLHGSLTKFLEFPME